MPTYRNDNNYPSKPFARPDGGLLIVRPGKSVELDFAVPYDDIGLTQVSASSPVIHDKVLTSGSYAIEVGGNQDISIPYTNRRILISVVAERGGTIQLKKAGSSREIEVSDTTGGYMSPEKGEVWAECPSINISSVSGANAIVMVEEV